MPSNTTCYRPVSASAAATETGVCSAEHRAVPGDCQVEAAETKRTLLELGVPGAAGMKSAQVDSAPSFDRSELLAFFFHDFLVRSLSKAPAPYRCFLKFHAFQPYRFVQLVLLLHATSLQPQGKTTTYS